MSTTDRAIVSGFANAVSQERIGDTCYAKGKMGDISITLCCEKGPKNGFINVAQMCKDAEKRLEHWKENQNSRNVKEAVAAAIGLEVDQLEFLERSKKHPRIAGTYVHPILATCIMSWISPTFNAHTSVWVEEWKRLDGNADRYWEQVSKISSEPSRKDESIIQNLINDSIDSEIEVKTPIGRIDVLTDDLLIEIKNAHNWMHGVGQLKIYGDFYPDHKQVLVLFDGEENETIRELCHKNEISVLWNDQNLIDNLLELCADVAIKSKDGEINRLLKIAEKNGEDIKEMIKEHRKTQLKLDRANEEADRRMQEFSLMADARMQEVKKEVYHVRDELYQVQDDLYDAHEDIKDISKKLGNAKNDRVVNTGDPSDRNCFALCKLNEDPDDYEDGLVPWDYLVLRVSQKSFKARLDARKDEYPNLEVVLKIDYTPNSMILYRRIRNEISAKITISGNYIGLEGKYTEKQLIKDIMNIHNARMTDYQL